MRQNALKPKNATYHQTHKYSVQHEHFDDPTKETMVVENHSLVVAAIQMYPNRESIEKSMN
jgi:hypothetical protein